MTTPHDFQHKRKISQINSGEIELWGSSDGGTVWYPVKVSPGGYLKTGATSSYAISDKDDDASPNYFGFIDDEVGWYILE